MPWSKSDVSRFKKGLSDSEKEKWVEIANSALRSCLDKGGKQDECEAKAIRIANDAAGDSDDENSSDNNNDYNPEHEISSLLHNMSAHVSRRELNGKPYLAVPTVLITENVLKGKYYSSEEIEKSVDTWNGRPVVVEHSTYEDGSPKSANSPEEWEKRKVGELFNTHFESGKLKAESWIDEERLKEVPGGREVLRRLESDEPLEVSTGVRAKNVPVQGNFSGKTYHYVAVDQNGDHLAILPFGKGECSWDDGAGMPRLNSRSNTMGNEPDENASKETQNSEGTTQNNEGMWSRVLTELDKLKSLMANKENNSMERDKMIEELTKLAQFSEDDKSTLQNFSDEGLKSLYDSKVEANIQEAESNKQTATSDNNASEKASEKTVEANESDQPKTAEEWIKTAPPQIQEVLRASLQMHESKRSELVESLVANERCDFTREELKAKTPQELERLHKLANPPNYEGKGGSEPNLNSQDNNSTSNGVRTDISLAMPSIEGESK